jgi:cytochrome P450
MNTARIDLLSPDVRHDPFPVYRELRRQGPACQVDPGGLWALTRYGDIASALQDTATYSSRGFRAALAPEWLGDDRLASSLIAIDPPEHSRLRGAIQRMFGRELIAQLERPLREYVRRLVNRIDASSELEVVHELASPIAAAALAIVHDINPEDHRRFKRWVDMIGMITPVPPEPAVAAAIRDAIEELYAYFQDVIEQRRKRPGNDLASRLLATEVDGRPLSMPELLMLLTLVLGAGIDTTVFLLAKSLLLLSERPDLVQRLAAAKQLIPDFVEEMLRYDPPTHALLRLTTRDVQLEGTLIPEGSYVLLLLASANRDPAQYPQPDEFVLERKPRGSLSFGYGPHVCVGAALARFEARVTLEVLLERFAGFERDTSVAIEWDRAIHTRGPRALPMRFVPRAVS